MFINYDYFYLILKVKRYDFVDSIKLNKITLHSALPFILLGLSVYFIFIILLNCTHSFREKILFQIQMICTNQSME